jgi:hypothetical protein
MLSISAIGGSSHSDQSLLPLRCRQSLKKICNSVLSTTSEFSCIKERAPAGRTFLVPDVRPLWIDHTHHSTIAPWAPIAVDFVGLPAFPRIADIDRCCRVLGAQLIAFSDIKPDAFTVFAAIDFDAFVLERFHVISAFRANHRNWPVSTLTS